MTTPKRFFCIRLPLMILVVLLALTVVPAMVSAGAAPDDPDVADVVDDGDVKDDEDVVDEAPAFNNPAQAQKAENVANAAALDSDDPELADRVENAEKAEQELAEARKNLRSLPDDATEEERRQARQDVREARQDVKEARAAVAERLSEISGELQADITKMREEGYGWGVIAKEYGIHPSALGLGNKFGHRKGQKDQERARNASGKKGEFAEATARDVKTGWGSDHGMSARGKSKGVGTKALPAPGAAI